MIMAAPLSLRNDAFLQTLAKFSQPCPDWDRTSISYNQQVEEHLTDISRNSVTRDGRQNLLESALMDGELREHRYLAMFSPDLARLSLARPNELAGILIRMGLAWGGTSLVGTGDTDLARSNARSNTRSEATKLVLSEKIVIELELTLSETGLGLALIIGMNISNITLQIMSRYVHCNGRFKLLTPSRSR